eukprot:3296383-Rhodomonas_salina.1
MGDDHSLRCLVGAFAVPLILLWSEESAHRENQLMVDASNPSTEMFLSGKWKQDSLEAEMLAIFGSAAGSEGESPNAGDSARECEEGAR